MNVYSQVLRVILVPAIAIFSSALSHEAIAQNKCVDAKGKVTYSDTLCPPSTNQKKLNFGDVSNSSPAVQDGGQLSKLRELEKRRSWALQSAEIDLKNTSHPAYIRGAEMKVVQARNDLASVQMRILQLTDPDGYERLLARIRQQGQEDRIRAAQEDATAARAQAAAAERSAAVARQDAELAAQRAAIANQHARQQIQQNNSRGTTYMRSGDFSYGPNGQNCFHFGSFIECK